MRSIRAFPILVAAVMAFTGANQASASMLAGVDALKEWNLIVFNNMSGADDVEGRAFIGGNLTGNSMTFYNNPGNNPSQNNNPAVTVVGNVSDSTSNINNAGGANIGGNLTSQNGFNLNGTQTLNVGGTSSQANINQNTVNANLGSNFTNTLISQKNLLVSSLNSLSTNLAALASTNTATSANNTLTLTASGTGQQVFNLSMSDLTNVGQISVVNPNGATVVVNVSGTSGTIADNFINTANDIGTDVIWNFYQATSLNFNTAFMGTVLATDATVSNNNYIQGTLVANAFNQNGEIHMDTFQGNLNTGTVITAPEPSTWAMLLLGFGLVGAAMRRRGQRSLVPQAA